MNKLLLSFLVFTLSSIFANGEIRTIKVIFGNLSFSDASVIETIDADENILLTFDVGSNSYSTPYKPNFVADNNAIRLYWGNTMTISAAEGYSIEKFVITSTTDRPIKSNTKVSTGDLNVNNNIGTWVGSSSSIVFTQPGTSGNSQFLSIEISYTLIEADTRPEVELSFPKDSYKGFFGEEFESPNLTCSIAAALSQVKYSSSNTDVAIVDAKGLIHLTGLGETTVYAYIPADNQDYRYAMASFVLNVIDLSNYKTELTTSCFPNEENSYYVRRYEDGAGTEYTVCAKRANADISFLFNNNTNTGKGSGLYLTKLSDNIIVDNITIEFNSDNTGYVDVYSYNQSFESPVAGTEFIWPETAEKIASEVSTNTPITINNFAFAITAPKLTYIDKITITYKYIEGETSKPFECEDFEKSYTLLKGETYELNIGEDAPAIIFSSSDNEVATVEGNVLKAVGSGNAVITATWQAVEGVWHPGSESFGVSVAFDDLTSLLQKCKDGETYAADFQVIVACAKDNLEYVTDGHAWAVFCEENTTGSHNEGEIIPSGWTGKYAYQNGQHCFTQPEHGEIEKTSAYVPVEYRDIQITDDMAGEYLVLQNVTFDTETPSACSTFTGTYNDREYRFCNQFEIAQVSAGEYNVKATVAFNDDNGLLIYPIEYISCDAVTSAPMHNNKEYSPDDIVEFTGLESGAHIYYRHGGDNPDPENAFAEDLNPAKAPRRAAALDENPTYNNTTHPLIYQEGMKVKYLAKAPGKAASAINYIALSNGTITGVSNILADNDNEAVYYNLQGVRVGRSTHLQPGLYIRVVAGKASKVVIY